METKLKRSHDVLLLSDEEIQVGDKFIDKHSPWSIRTREKTEENISGKIASSLYTHFIKDCSKVVKILPL